MLLDKDWNYTVTEDFWRRVVGARHSLLGVSRSTFNRGYRHAVDFWVHERFLAKIHLWLTNRNLWQSFSFSKIRWFALYCAVVSFPDLSLHHSNTEIIIFLFSVVYYFVSWRLLFSGFQFTGSFDDEAWKFQLLNCFSLSFDNVSFNNPRLFLQNNCLLAG